MFLHSLYATFATNPSRVTNQLITHVMKHLILLLFLMLCLAGCSSMNHTFVGAEAGGALHSEVTHQVQGGQLAGQCDFALGK